MAGFILLLISIVLVFTSSYFLTTLFQSNRHQNNIIFWILVVFSQVILSFEILSLLGSINIPAFMATNSIIFIITLIIWFLRGKPAINIDWTIVLMQKIKTALNRDRILLILICFFIFAYLINLFLAVYAPVNIWDSLTYQVARVAFWIQHGTLAHFETSSVRQLIFPPNSELLILWILLFIKTDFLLRLVEYAAGFSSFYVIYCFLSYLKISIRRTLWTILVFAAFPIIIIHSSSIQNHLILGFLLLSALYLFVYGVFENEKKSLFFSAIALGISIGVKSSVFLFLPGIFITFLLILIRKKGKDFYKTGFQYVSYLFLVFLLMSSYFYIMNYLEFGHPLGVKSYIYEHTYMNKGFKSLTANFIRYIIVFFDFTGINKDLSSILNFPVYFLRVIIFSVLNLSPMEGLTNQADYLLEDNILSNFSINDMRSGLGLTGLFVLLPLLFSGIKHIFSKSDKTFLLGLCGFLFIAFILTISSLMGYEIWNNRYFVTAAVISSPVLAFSYCPRHNNFKKLFIAGICIAFFIKIPLCNELRPIIPVKGMSLLTNSRNQIRYDATSMFENIFRDPAVYLETVAAENTAIGIIQDEKHLYYQYFIHNPEWRIYLFNMENLNVKKLKESDFLVVYGQEQTLYSLKNSKSFHKKFKIDFDLILKYFKPVYTIETILDKERYKYAQLGNNFKFRIFRRKED